MLGDIEKFILSFDRTMASRSSRTLAIREMFCIFAVIIANLIVVSHAEG